MRIQDRKAIAYTAVGIPVYWIGLYPFMALMEELFRYSTAEIMLTIYVISFVVYTAYWVIYWCRRFIKHGTKLFSLSDVSSSDTYEEPHEETKERSYTPPKEAKYSGLKYSLLLFAVGAISIYLIRVIYYCPDIFNYGMQHTNVIAGSIGSAFGTVLLTSPIRFLNWGDKNINHATLSIALLVLTQFQENNLFQCYQSIY